MKDLQDLVRVFALYSKKSFDIFLNDNTKGSHGKMHLLYDAIASGTVGNDVDACKYLYGSAVDVSPSTYNSVKARLTRRLVDSCSHLDSEKAFASERTKVRQQCLTDVAALKILQLYSANEAVISLANRLYKTAREYHVTSAAKDAILVLAQLEAYAGREAAFERIASEAAVLVDEERAENLATLHLQRVSSWYAAYWSLRQDNEATIKHYITELAKMKEQFRSVSIHECYYLVSKIYAEVQQNYSMLLTLAAELQAYYDTVPHLKSKLIFSQFVISSMAASIWMGQYEDAKEKVVQVERLVSKGKAAWFAFKEYHIILAQRMKDYTLARSIFLEVVTHPNFRRDDPLMMQKWQLLEFYVRFVSGDQQMRTSLLPSEELKGRSKYRHFRAFSASFGVLSKDLHGYNVVAVFAQILFLLRVRDFDALIQRDESLQTLRRKRLSKLNYRLAIFSHLIHVMVEHNFEVATIERASANWLRKLRNVPPKYKGGTAETLEIIPLEDLWEMMVDELKHPQRHHHTD